MSSTRLIAAAVCLGVLAAAGYWYSSSTSSMNVSSGTGGAPLVDTLPSTDPYAIEITYTDEGYEPRDVVIQRGERVRFVNKSTYGMWPASAIHPTHSIYPDKTAHDCLGSAFDACKTLENGQFFAFTFNHAGEWRYHDHIHAQYTGTITVVN